MHYHGLSGCVEFVPREAQVCSGAGLAFFILVADDIDLVAMITIVKNIVCTKECVSPT